MKDIHILTHGAWGLQGWGGGEGGRIFADVIKIRMLVEVTILNYLSGP